MLTAASTTFGADLAAKAVQALVDEALLTPKPGLVDTRDSGSHSDMSIGLMIKSARALEETFQRIADASYLHPVDQSLREKIASIGREGEQQMFSATNGVNTHKGAIWALGLLTSARAACPGECDPHRIMREALALVLAFGFGTMGLNRIEGLCHPDNTRAGGLFRGLGFQREGLLREYRHTAAGFQDVDLYALLRSGQL